ncbi:MAG TPA: hypothetical protein VKC54_03940 [Patescibacteria group bacterium]|nr:hypothetical protein [Patescibacteria group bacterium]
MLAQLNLDEVERAGVGPLFARYGSSGIGGIISALLPYIFSAAGIALLIYLILGGFQLMTSRGDPKAMQAAQGKITNAILGFVVVIISFALVRLLGQLFGINAFSQVFGGSPSGQGRP